MERSRKSTHLDPLTGLYNRHCFLKTLNHIKHPGALLYVDLDNFRQINYCHSHQFGDRFLKSVSDRLKKLCGKQDLLFHTGPGEFYVLKSGQFEPQQLAQEAEKIVLNFRKPFKMDNKSIYTSVSIGVFNFVNLDMTQKDMLIAVDMALYEAKKNGKNGFAVYIPEMGERLHQQHHLEGAIRQALTNREIEVYYQPQYSLKDHSIIGVEALARWNKNGKIILPDEFIPVAESSLVIIPIGEFIMEQACKEIYSINQKRYSPLRLAINVSSVQLKHSDFLAMVTRLLKQTGFPPQLLDLEITESILMDDVDFYLPQLTALSNLGIQITIDDFGTGYSSLSYLQKFPLKKLKVDKSFLEQSTDQQSKQQILNAILKLANSIGLTTVAEGVESRSQLDQIQNLNCDTMQGFYFAKPMPFEDLRGLTEPQIKKDQE